MSLRNLEIKLSPRNAQKLDSYATIRTGKRCRKVAISITPAQLDDLEKYANAFDVTKAEVVYRGFLGTIDYLQQNFPLDEGPQPTLLTTEQMSLFDDQ
tara:strand:- start:6773 stop:7066 length:294 start_codon:yes stop_codon:yes gene_type:complete